MSFLRGIDHSFSYFSSPQRRSPHLQTKLMRLPLSLEFKERGRYSLRRPRTVSILKRVELLTISQARKDGPVYTRHSPAQRTEVRPLNLWTHSTVQEKPGVSHERLSKQVKLRSDAFINRRFLFLPMHQGFPRDSAGACDDSGLGDAYS